MVFPHIIPRLEWCTFPLLLQPKLPSIQLRVRIAQYNFEKAFMAYLLISAHSKYYIIYDKEELLWHLPRVLNIR